MPSAAERLAARFTEDAGFLSTELRSERTGIRDVVLAVYAGEFSRAEAHLGPRLQVVGGARLAIEGLADSVPVTLTEPPVVHGALPGERTQQVVAFARRHRDVLLRHWHGEIDSGDVIQLIMRPHCTPHLEVEAPGGT